MRQKTACWQLLACISAVAPLTSQYYFVSKIGFCDQRDRDLAIQVGSVALAEFARYLMPLFVGYRMTQPIARDVIYRRCRFKSEVIETAVRWYITYRLSYRDLVALMAERKIKVSHTTLHRWVIRFVPEYERRWNRRAKPANSSWRVDETYIN